LNPFVFRLIDPIKNWAVQHSKLAHRLEFPSLAHAQLPNNTSAHYLKGQVVLVGYGRVGKRIAQALKHQHIPFVIIEMDPDVVSKLRHHGMAAIVGNATDISVLEQAHVQEATMLIIAMPDPFDEIVIIEQAKKLNPNIELVLRTHNETESELLSGHGRVFFGEEELAKGMSNYICERFSSKSV
jgi:CPA2 family monovalent cation:H+ antiporter-2